MTHKIYLDNTYCFNCKALIIKSAKDEYGDYIVFNKTVFHPESEDQPSDRGYIVVGQKKYIIYYTRLINNEVRHYSDSTEPIKITGDWAQLFINQDFRMFYSKGTTASHLLGNVVETVDFGLSPIKGEQFAKGLYQLEGNYVVFRGEPKDPNNLLDLVNKKMDMAIKQQETLTSAVLNKETLAELFSNYEIPIPEGETAKRVLFIGNYRPLPCGYGTPVKSLAEIEYVEATQLKIASKETLIYYTFC